MREPILFLPLLVFADGQSQRPTRTSSAPPPLSAITGQIQIPNRPSDSLFISQQGKQRTEIRFDPATALVTLKLLVQDLCGYFIPDLRRDNFVVYENDVRQTNATVEIEHAPVSLALALECGGRYPNLTKILANQVFEGGRTPTDRSGRPGGSYRDLEICGPSGTNNRLLTRPRNAQYSAQFPSTPQYVGSEFV
jgi:hypothetical protein